MKNIPATRLEPPVVTLTLLVLSMLLVLVAPFVVGCGHLCLVVVPVVVEKKNRHYPSQVTWV